MSSTPPAERFAPSVRVVPSSSQVSSEVGGETVILNLATDRYHGLAHAGARIWALLGEGRTVGEIERTLLAEYDIDPDTCRRDLVNLLAELEEKGLVEVRGAP